MQAAINQIRFDRDVDDNCKFTPLPPHCPRGCPKACFFTFGQNSHYCLRHVTVESDLVNCRHYTHGVLQISASVIPYELQQISVKLEKLAIPIVNMWGFRCGSSSDLKEFFKNLDTYKCARHVDRGSTYSFLVS